MAKPTTHVSETKGLTSASWNLKDKNIKFHMYGLNIQILWDMQTFDTRLQLKIKFTNKHTIENTSSDWFLSA